MRVLIIKTSSLGDIIHTLPALSDAVLAIPHIQFDWLVEESFADIPAWHPAVNRVIKMAWRRWRKSLMKKSTRAEMRDCFEEIQRVSYDYIIDAQGLLKSAVLSLIAKGVRCGYAWGFAREPLASLFYQRKCFTSKIKSVHAVERIRELFSQVFTYPLPKTSPNYGLNRRAFAEKVLEKNYVIFLHGTTWPTKHWPESYWQELAIKVEQLNIDIYLPWGNSLEKARAESIARVTPRAHVFPSLTLQAMAEKIAGARAIVALDTGLGHIAGALNVPMISLYGATDPHLTGVLGGGQVHLSVDYACSPCLRRKCIYKEELSITPPCFSTLPPSLVYKALEKIVLSSAPNLSMR